MTDSDFIIVDMERKSKQLVRPRRGPRRVGKLNTPFWRKKYSVEDIARTAYQGVQQIRRLINVEVKAVDTYVSNSPDNSTVNTTFVSALSSIAQGDSYNNRDGLSVKYQKLHVSGHFVSTFTAINESVVRILIVKDLEQVGSTVPSTSDIIETASGFLVNNPLNILNMGRFKIIDDFRLSVSFQGNAIALFDREYVLKGHCHFSGSSATTWTKDGIYLVAMSDQSSELPTLTWSARVTYTDN